ncbi:MAG: L-2-amino-thiazoline-4-carboxylic acid hydrolase [Erysipelotrichaceae bacterium]|nr:L-2-amino-thiazoline-4-carboxylic acid hydrolase [Erysipelotrichaceae bacterium]
MKKEYRAEKLIAVSRYRNYFPTLEEDLKQDILARMRELLQEEKEYCDEGNYRHMAQILTSIALYEVLQRHGRSEEEAYAIVSQKMWDFLDPGPMKKMAKLPFFLPLMKKIVPFGFKKGSGKGWRYTWHEKDPEDEFHFECNECIYEKILRPREMLKLGAMCCHADIINYGDLPYTDFRRTQTLCQGGDLCDFCFIRHKTDAGKGWTRFKSI